MPRAEPAVRLVHLAWGPLGVAQLEAFLRRRAEVDPGVEHELLVLLNGFAPDAAAEATARVRDSGGEPLVLDAPVQDLEAYRQGLAAAPAGAWVLANSYARPLADGWLAALVDAVRDPGTLAAATGSYETQRVPFPPEGGGARRAAAHLGPAVRSRLAFGAFPNPHLRTNALALTRETLAGLRWPVVGDKRAALALEGGRRGLSAQARALWLVDRDGRRLAHPGWPDADVFRSGEQERLLVADNRTDQYAQADAAERRRLRQLAWG